MPAVTLLLPPRSHFAGQRLPDALARALGRADCLPANDPGERAQLLRHFDLLPRSWPVAALTRNLDAGDAEAMTWLRADPVWIRPDINGARLMAWGEMLRLGQDDVDALLPALRPLFGDLGFSIDAPTPSRWYLRLPRDMRLPAFVDPEDVLGVDVFDHLPGTDDTSSEARRWRALASEAQVLLHNHPWNAQRAAAGKPPINALWFWGAGVQPDHVSTRYAQVHSDDALVNAFAKAAGIAHASLRSFDVPVESGLHDLRNVAAPVCIADWLVPIIDAIARGAVTSTTFDFADGSGFMIERKQCWRLWRKPMPDLAQ